MIPWITALLLLQPAAGEQEKDPKVQDRLENQEDRIRELEKKLGEVEKRQSQTLSANPLTVLNPTLTVAGDFLWRFDDKKVFLEDDPALDRIDDTINVREVELDLRASVDPFVDGVAVIAVESEVPGDFEVAVEEFYATVKSLPLPFWEQPPLGTRIKVGRFRTEFGLNNKSHTHDLPQSDRPLAVQEFLGEEGHAASGLSTTSMLPFPGDSALELTLQVLQGGGANIGADPNSLAYLANVNLFVPVADEHSVNLALMGFYGTNDPEGRDQSRVGSVDVLYKWKPHRQGEYTSFLLGGQAFFGRHEFPVAFGHDATSPFGYSAWAQYQATSRLYFGARWDRADFLEDDTSGRKRISPYITWYTSEFFRSRLTWQHTWSDEPIQDDLDSFLVELVVVFGAHPPEPFWVNK